MKFLFQRILSFQLVFWVIICSILNLNLIIFRFKKQLPLEKLLKFREAVSGLNAGMRNGLIIIKTGSYILLFIVMTSLVNYYQQSD